MSSATYDSLEFHDEETASLVAPSSSSQEHFDVPSTEVKRYRKFSIGSIALATLVLFAVAFMPENSASNNKKQPVMEMQEVGRLNSGEANVAVAKGIFRNGYTKDFQIFSGSQAIPVANIPHQGEDFKTYSAAMSAKMEKVNGPGGGGDGGNSTKVGSNSSDPVGSAISSMPEQSSEEVKKSSPSSSSQSNMKAEEEKIAADAKTPNSESQLILCTAEVEYKNEDYQPPKGCALLSDVDFTFSHDKAHVPANALVICAPANIGTFPLDAETLESFGLVKNGKSMISTVLAGEDTSVAAYSGEAFDGNSYVVNHVKKLSASDSLSHAHFIDMAKSQGPNDNIKSVIFQTTAASTPDSCKEVKATIGFRQK